MIFKKVKRSPIVAEAPTVSVSKLPRHKEKQYFDESELKKYISNLSESDLLALASEDAAIWIMLHTNMHGPIMVDKDPFTFWDHKYLVPIYSCNAREIAIMKAAQLGLTIWLSLRMVHFATTAPTPIKAGVFFPTQPAADRFSKDRLGALIHDNPALVSTSTFDHLVEKNFKDSQAIKRIGASSVYILYMGGKVQQDSVPLDCYAIDEVRECEEVDFPRVEERLSHSRYKRQYFISTAKLPGADIHAQFLMGTQNFWHSKCGCGRRSLPGGVVKDDPEKWVVLHEHFPECIVDYNGEFIYVCPKCNYHIRNPQNGLFIPRNPGVDRESFHISQFLSSRIEPRDIIGGFHKAQAAGNVAEFYWSKLGIPYVDEESKMSIEEVRSCEDDSIIFGINKKVSPREIAMGVDQRSGENHIVIVQRVGDKIQLVHLEVVDQNNPLYYVAGKIVSPFRRCYELMEQFDVDCCICDKEPNTNDAMAFGREFPGKVWLMKYADYVEQPVMWSDRKGSERSTTRQSTEPIKFRWSVKLHRYQTIERTLRLFKEKKIIVPRPSSLIQYLRDKSGNYIRTEVCREIYYRHMIGVSRKVEQSKRTGEIVSRWVNHGLDPHFLHATTYAFVALERVKGFDFSFI